MVHVSEMPPYPLINTQATLGDYLALPLNYALAKLSEYGYEKVRERRVEQYRRGEPPSRFLGAIDRLLEQAKTGFTQQFDVGVQKISPRIAIYRAFWNGASAADRLYTVEFEDAGLIYEMPVYLKKEEQEEPSTELLQENIKKIVTAKVSPYNDELSQFYQPLFNYGVVKYTRNDYNAFLDQVTWRKWLVRMGLWNHQQFGIEEGRWSLTMTTGNTTRDYTIRQYSRPGLLNRFLYWFLGDLVYDVIDWPFDRIQEATEVAIDNGWAPHTLRDDLVAAEYKGISGLLRTLFRNYLRHPLEFDLSPKEAVLAA